MSSPAESNQDQIVPSAVPSGQGNVSENPVPLDLSMNVPTTSAETAVRNVRFSDDIFTIPQVSFLEPTGWFFFSNFSESFLIFDF